MASVDLMAVIGSIFVRRRPRLEARVAAGMAAVAGAGAAAGGAVVVGAIRRDRTIAPELCIGKTQHLQPADLAANFLSFAHRDLAPSPRRGALFLDAVTVRPCGEVP